MSSLAPVAETGVVRVATAHAAQLAAFYRRAWDPAASTAGVLAARRAAARRNVAHPGAEPPTYLFLLNGEPVGHLTTLPTRLWVAGRAHPAHWLKGLMVLPEHRRGPVGFYLVREAVAQLPLCLAAVVAPEARRLFLAAGLRDAGAIPNRVRLLSPAAALRTLAEAPAAGIPHAVRLAGQWLGRSRGATALAAGTAALAAAGWTALASPRGAPAARILPTVEAGELDALWERVARELNASPVRDAAYLIPRYAEGGPYHLLGVHERGRLCGFAALRGPAGGEGDPRLRGMRVAVLAELVAPPSRPGVLASLVAGAERVARGVGADAVLCSASHPAAGRVLGRRAFLPVPANVHLMVCAAQGGPALPQDLTAWWLTRGDSLADEVF